MGCWRKNLHPETEQTYPVKHVVNPDSNQNHQFTAKIHIQNQRNPFCKNIPPTTINSTKNRAMENRCLKKTHVFLGTITEELSL